MNAKTLTEQINKTAVAYRMGGLQELRRRLHGRGPRTNKIFTATTTFDESHIYAFHYGGRTELQFNIGMEKRNGRRWWRHGVAFSFVKSRSLPDPGMLRPKVNRFNAWVRANVSALRGFKMWHWKGQSPSGDRLPGEIPDALVRAGAFVTLGVRLPEAEVDVNRILDDFDRLLPLYEFIESSGVVTELRNASVGFPEEVPEGSTYSEGSVQRVLVNRYERDARARDRCIRRHGTICVLCGFDFVAEYGEVMRGFTHVHHLKPLSSVAEDYRVDPIRDLRPVCPNCHAVLHRREPSYSLQEVRQFLQNQKGRRKEATSRS